MADISGGRWAASFRRLFGLKGITSQVMAVGWEVQPTLAVEDPRAPEMAWLRGDRLQHAGATIQAVAGEYGHIQLMNLSTNHLAVIERIFISVASATKFVLALYDTAFAASVQVVINRDRRQDYAMSSAATTLIVPDATTDVSQLGTRFATMRCPANNTVVYDSPIVLAPATGVLVRAGTVNLGFETSFAWRQRPAEPGELDFS